MLVFVRASRYDAGIGRFTQQDPIGIAGGANVYGFAGGDPVNFADPFGLSDCKKDSQADGSKDCPREADNQADGYKGCDYTSGEGCSAETKRVIAADQPVEQAGQTIGAVATIAAGGLALRAGVLAFRARAAAGVALSTETGLGIVQGLQAQLPSGDHQVFIPTGSPRQKAVAAGVWVAIEIVKRKLNVDW